MKNRNSIKKFIFLAAMIQTLPTMAAADPRTVVAHQLQPSDIVSVQEATQTLPAIPLEPDAPVGPSDLSLAGAKAEIPDFKVEVTGRSPDETISLRGVIFQDCAGLIDVQSNIVDSDGHLGFEIKDKGGFKSCQAKHSKDTCGQPDANGVQVVCNLLSANPNASFSAASLASGDIGLLYHPSGNHDGGPEYAFDGIDKRHSSADDVKAAALAAREEAKLAHIDELNREFKGCRHNMDELVIAQGALDDLISVAKLSEAQADKDRADLKKSELNILAAEVKKVKTTDEDAVQDLMDQLQTFADENPDSADKIAALHTDLATRIVSRKGATTADFDLAKSVITQAQGLSVSDANSAALQNWQTQLEVGRVSASIASNNFNPMTFYPSYMSAMQMAAQSYKANCGFSGMSMGGGTQSISDACTGSLNNLRDAAQLPQVAQTAIQQQQQFAMQMQQMMNQSMQPSTNVMNGNFASNPMMMNTNSLVPSMNGITGLSGTAGNSLAGNVKRTF